MGSAAASRSGIDSGVAPGSASTHARTGDIDAVAIDLVRCEQVVEEGVDLRRVPFSGRLRGGDQHAGVDERGRHAEQARARQITQRGQAVDDGARVRTITAAAPAVQHDQERARPRLRRHVLDISVGRRRRPDADAPASSGRGSRSAARAARAPSPRRRPASPSSRGEPNAVLTRGRAYTAPSMGAISVLRSFRRERSSPTGGGVLWPKVGF